MRIKRYNPAWGSHIPVLIKIFEISEGPVLEIGVGVFSTPILHSICLNKNRHLTSYESDEYYCSMQSSFANDLHQINLVKNWDDIKIEDTQWGMAFIDHVTERRSTEAKRLANIAKFVIIHDSDPGCDKYYKYSDIYPLFKYRLDYTKTSPNTTILSNFVDLSNLVI